MSKAPKGWRAVLPVRTAVLLIIFGLVGGGGEVFRISFPRSANSLVGMAAFASHIPFASLALSGSLWFLSLIAAIAALPY